MTSLLFYKLLFLAIIPAFIMGAGVYLRDRYMREPLLYVGLAFGCGILAQLVAIVLEAGVVHAGYAYQSEEYAESVLQAAITSGEHLMRAFFGETLPNVAAQILLLYCFLYYNPYFHDRHDATVYGSMLGLGFAFMQNLIYMLTVLDRGDGVVLYGHLLTAIPVQMLVGLLIGYYYSMYYYGVNGRKKARLLYAVIMPMLAHMAYSTTYYLVIRRMDSIWVLLIFAALLYVIAIWTYLGLRSKMDTTILRHKRSNRQISYYYNTDAHR